MPNAPITIGTIVTFMFHSLFNSLARSTYLSFFSLSFRFIYFRDSKVDNFTDSLFLFVIIIIIIFIIIIIIIIIIIHSLELFTPELADGISLESEW